MSKQVGYAEALSRPAKKAGPKELRSLEIEKGSEGGHTVTQRFKNNGDGPYHESEGPIIFGESEGKKLIAHLTEHLGIKTGGEEE